MYTSKMTIYVNGKFLCQQTTGVQSYAHAMLTSLQLLNCDVKVLMPKRKAATDKYHVKKMGFFSNLVLWEQISLPAFMRKQSNAILLNFCNTAPLWCKSQIVTVHDLAFEKKNTRWFSFLFKTWYRFLIPRICRRAISVFTVSDFSKKELLQHYKLHGKKIEIIPNVYVAKTTNVQRMISDNYVLLTGAENPRKNVGWVLDRLKEIEEQGLKLVLLNSHSKVFARQQACESPSVILLDYVSEEEYYSLILHCSALIYPSLYEGFGAPVLEGLCMKRPVICNDLPVFRESFGDLPIYLNPENENSLSEALLKIKSWKISDPEVEHLKSKFSLKTAGSLIVKSLNQLM